MYKKLGRLQSINETFRKDVTKEMPRSKKEQKDRLELVLAEISCDNCRTGLIEHLQKLPGVKNVKVSLAKKRVAIGFEPEQTSRQEIEKLLVALGYSL